jgi:CO/xanthine dehydrogenase FAD-binding subunit
VLQHVYVPTEIEEAIARLGEEHAALLSGGTLLMPVINNDVTPIRALVSVRRLGLDGIERDDGHASIGAAATLAQVGRDPALTFLQPVVESIASPLIRNLATVGGNLFAPQPYGDFAVALLALDAAVDVSGPNGTRQAPVASVLANGVASGEIVTSVTLAIPEGDSWFYTKAMRRKLNSAAVVTVAAVIERRDGLVAAARIALGGVGAKPVRAPTVEGALMGKPLDLASVTAAAALAVEDAEPCSDAYASAWYRTRVLPVHVRRAILGG